MRESSSLQIEKVKVPLHTLLTLLTNQVAQFHAPILLSSAVAPENKGLDH